jgi:hypothetical protein
MPGTPGGMPLCQILDRSDDALYDVSLNVIGDAEVDGLGETGMIEFDAAWQFAYFERVLWGAMDVNLDMGLTSLSDSDAAEDIGELIRLALDVGWTWRFYNGLAFQLNARPGIYADSGEMSGGLYYPVSASVIYSFSDSVSLLLGADMRKDYGEGLWPLVQLEWEAAPACRLRLGFPENRLSVFMGKRWQAYLGCDWRSDSYWVGGEDDDHEIVTFEDTRAYAGVGFDISDELTVSLDVGTVMDRELAFDEMGGGADDDYDVDDATMVKLAITGPF